MPARPSRHMMTARLRPEMVERYEAIHRSPPPEVGERLRSSHLRDYVIVRSGTVLFATFEYHGDDLAADLSAFRDDPAMHGWMATTDACLDPVDAGSDRRWTTAQEVFRC